MQNFLIITLILGLSFFLYLLKSGQINTEEFNIKNLRGNTEFIIKQLPDDGSIVKTSEIYAIVKNQEYKIFTFSGKDFNKLSRFEFADNKYKVPLEAKDAVTGTWIGNRYVFYMLETKDKETGKYIYDIYKTEYPTDDLSKLKYTKIKSVNEKDFETNNFEVNY